MIVLTKDLILKIINNDNYLFNYFGKVNKIELLSLSENVVYLISGEKNRGIAKIGYRGWNKIEFENHKKLYKYNYPVAKPLKYIPIQGNILENWGWGNLKRELGILFCDYIEGKSMDKSVDKKIIIKAIKLLKKIHLDERLRDKNIKNYHDIEIDRGKSYINILNANLRSKILDDMESYRNIPLNLTFIHGGARIEHFICSYDKISLIDLEASSMGDPFKDIVYFFIDLLMNQIYSKEFLNIYFDNKLTSNEIKRLNFFTIRQLLIKVKYGTTPEIKEKSIKFLKLKEPVKILGVD